MSKKPVERNPDGTVKPGQSLRTVGRMKAARFLSRDLKRQMKERFGSERPYYDWLMDIAASTNEKTADRIKAIEQLANRVDGKPVQAVDLQVQGEMETRSSPLQGMSVEQLLAIAKGGQP